jgi:hypothetical protein
MDFELKNPSEETFWIEWEQDYLRDFTIESIHPQPHHTELGNKKVRMYFKKSPGALYSVNVEINLKAEKMGFKKMNIVMDQNPSIQLTQFFFP